MTGASGFIGSNIMDSLEQRGHTVYGCCHTKIVEKDNFITCDLSKHMPDLQVDVVVHAAAVSPSGHATFNDYFTNNVIVSKNVLEYAKIHHVKRIIYIGAVSSYGKINGVLREDSPHNDPEDYGLTKYMAEKMVRNSKIPYYILILPGVVGKGCKDIWIMKAAKAIYSNKALNYYNGQGIFNNILEIGDLCQFIVKLLDKEQCESDTYLLGSREKMLTDDVIKYLRDKLSSDSQLCERRKDNKASFYLDVQKALAAGFCSKPMKRILDEVCAEVLAEGELKNKWR